MLTLKIPVQNIEATRQIVLKHKIIDYDYKIKVENGFGYINITPEILKKYGVDPATPSNMINDFSNIRDVYVWTFVTYDEKNEVFKVNIRSKGPVINETAANFGGGGHKFASGVRTRDREVVDNLLKALEEDCRIYKLEINDVE